MTQRATLTSTSPLHYVPNSRAKLMYTAASQERVKATNPLGWNGPDLSTAQGVADFVGMYSQGHLIADYLIVWAIGGFHPRGDMYRWNGAEASPGVNIAAISDALAAVGLKLALAMRPSFLTYSAGWGYDDSMQLDYRNADQTTRLLNMLSASQSLSRARGFYFDSFGNSANGNENDQALLVMIRALFGPTVPIWSEYTTPASAQYCGTYGVVNPGYQTGQLGEPIMQNWGSDTWAKIRGQYPAADTAIKNMGNAPWKQIYNAGMRPLLDQNYCQVLTEIRALQAQQDGLAS